MITILQYQIHISDVYRELFDYRQEYLNPKVETISISKRKALTIFTKKIFRHKRRTTYRNKIKVHWVVAF